MAKNWKWGHEKTSWKSLSESDDDVFGDESSK